MIAMTARVASAATEDLIVMEGVRHTIDGGYDKGSRKTNSLVPQWPSSGLAGSALPFVTICSVP